MVNYIFAVYLYCSKGKKKEGKWSITKQQLLEY